jgi:hypothetical protein
MGLCHVYVVHMQVVPTDFINVIFFQCIQMSALPSCPYDSHSICYCSVCMPCSVAISINEQLPEDGQVRPKHVAV